MKRKIVAQGYQSLTLTLPIKWIREYGLKAGDEVEVQQKGHHLVLGYEKGKKIEKSVIIINDARKQIVKDQLMSAYRRGSDEIEIKANLAEVNGKEGNKIKVSKLITKIVNSLMGVSIVEQRKDYFKIKDVTGSSTEDFDMILRRAFLLVLSMGEQSYKALKEKDNEALEDIYLIYGNIRKFTDYCIRLLNKKEYKDYRKTANMYAVVHQLESIAYSYRHIANHFMDSKININKKMLDIYEDLNKYMRVVYEFFYSRKNFKELFELKDKIYLEIHSPNWKNAGTLEEGGLLGCIGTIRWQTRNLIRESLVMGGDEENR